MKKLFLSATVSLFGLTAGLVLAGSAWAAELPSADLKDQLKTDIEQQAATGISEGMNQTNPEPSPTPTPNPLIINTGDGATVDTSTSQSNQTTVNNTNQANVGQAVVATANTGGNQANYNISIGGHAGVIRTGDASVYNELQATANSNQAGVQSNCPQAGGGGQVVNSGSNVTVAGGSDSTCTTTITNGNGAVINQVATGEANTGDNQAIGNISIGGQAGVIMTGNARVGSMLVSRANSNVVLVGGSDGHGGPGTGANIYIINTGSDAVINDRRSSSQATTINNSNYAALTQLANLDVNTGGNSANGNINLHGDAGVIRTGDAVIDLSMAVEANHNQTAVALGDNQVGNGQTDVINSGSDLDLDTSSEANSSIEVNNSNQADVTQTVFLNANTGNNTANGNIAFGGNAGVIETGQAIIASELEVDVNKNQTVVSHGGNDLAGGADTELINAGDDVTVDTSTEVNTDIEVNNSNQAEVDQVVTAEANTGNNSANGNIGNSSISTGDVHITTEVITNANNNYTFIIDSEVTGFELFKQFVETFLGMSWEELVAGGGAGGFVANTGSTSMPGQNTSIVNSGDNVTILNEQTHNRQVVVNNSNQATVNQTVLASANTGGNSCVGNIGDCRITTGDATIWTRLIANLNNNFTFIGNVTLPEVPVDPEPETPTEPETPVEPEVKGKSVERPSIVLAAALPNTGGESTGLLGLGMLLLGLGAMLRRKV